MRATRFRGFTLVEIVVVVLIIGLLVAIALPRQCCLMGKVSDDSARRSLQMLRHAIESYALEHDGDYPGNTEALVKAALSPYLRGPFPKCPVGEGKADEMAVVSTGAPLIGTGSPGAIGSKMWKYDCQTGQIIINYSAVSESGVPYDEF
ncbi:MAG: prepilin-type N-terminal cleavage/methylation domain-containing protein [Pirellulales bacterium]|nr:prepilin-type N-terminal cleavage/methylation domain-containing protein [Pirellulales bacterium]